VKNKTSNFFQNFRLNQAKQVFNPSSGSPFCLILTQEPITRSFHLPYWPSESTLSRILVLEAPPTGVFVGVFIIANHERAVVLYCYKSNTARRKYFNNGGRRRYHSSKNKKIRDRLDWSVQFGWRLRVMGSCSHGIFAILRLPMSNEQRA